MTILVVDDKSENLELISTLFRAEGWEVQLAGNGQEALLQAQTKIPDLILSDILMPVMDGYELCRQVRQDPRLATLPFIFYTATYTDPEDEVFALSLGADRFLVKPQDPEVLLEETRAWLGKTHQQQEKETPEGECADAEFYQGHMRTVQKKLEKKVRDLETLNRMLMKEVQERIGTEMRLRTLGDVMERIPLSVVIFDTEGKVEYTNMPADRSPEGYRAAEEDAARLQAGEVVRKEFRRSGAGGMSRVEQLAQYPVADKFGHVTHTIAVAEDITELKTVQEMLLRNQRLEELGILSAGIAHDFNNYLTAIMGMTEMLRLRCAATPEDAESFDMLLSAAGKATDLVRRMLSFSRSGQEKKEPLDLGGLVKDFMVFLNHAVHQEVRMDLEVPDTPLVISGARSLLEQVLLNLVVNARDALKGSGQITVRVLQGATGKEALLEVADNGEGMDDGVKARIFEPFYTTKDKARGTGLGLVMVKSIVESHDGTMEVESEPGKGSTFRVRIPLSGGLS